MKSIIYIFSIFISHYIFAQHKYPENQDSIVLKEYHAYIKTNQYEKALEIINKYLDNNNKNRFKLYFRNNKSVFSYQDKVALLQHFNKKTELIEFLKKMCLDDFNFYFESYNPEERDWRLEDIKNKGFHKLKEVVYFMKVYNWHELDKYESIYQQLKYKQNEQYESINPNLSIAELIDIIKLMDNDN